MLNLTRPGMTLRLFGCTCTMPTVPRPCGGWRWAQATTSCISLAATCSASLRSAIGVGPACASMPVTVQSYQRMPSTPVTTPMVLSWSSSTGPCSMCVSK